jgi:hypothetical protein
MRKDKVEFQERAALHQELHRESGQRMQQLLHGIRLSASDDMTPADDLERLARLIEQRKNPLDRRRA